MHATGVCLLKHANVQTVLLACARKDVTARKAAVRHAKLLSSTRSQSADIAGAIAAYADSTARFRCGHSATKGHLGPYVSNVRCSPHCKRHLGAKFAACHRGGAHSYATYGRLMLSSLCIPARCLAYPFMSAGRPPHQNSRRSKQFRKSSGASGSRAATCRGFCY